MPTEFQGAFWSLFLGLSLTICTSGKGKEKILGAYRHSGLTRRLDAYIRHGAAMPWSLHS
jgi:hypothetical protein